MRQTLYIHLRDAEADAPLAFRIDGAAAGSVQHAPLADLAAMAPGARVVAIVPTGSLRFLGVSLPLRSRSRALAAAPFACEDQLAEDIDGLHFAWLGHSEDDIHHFAVVGRQRLEGWLACLAEAGLSAAAILPDCLCLPEPDADEWVAAAIDEQTLLLRQNRYQGSLVHAPSLPTLLQLAGDQAPAQLRLIQLGSAPELPELEGVTLRRQPDFGSLLDLLVRGAAEQGETANLLQGSYAPQGGLARHLRPWRAAAVLAGLAFALHVGFQWSEAVRLQRMTEAREAANLARFQQVLPGYRDVSSAQLPGIIASEMRRAQDGGSGTSLLLLLDSYARAASAVDGLSVRGAQWRDGALLLSLRGESLQSLEALRQWYEQQSGVLLDVENANASADGVQIRVRLRSA